MRKRGSVLQNTSARPVPDEIIFTRGTTESINLVAQAWGGKFIREGDVILLTVMEHHSNLVPWQLLAERTGARLRFLPVRDDGTLDVRSALVLPDTRSETFRLHAHLKFARHNQSSRRALRAKRARWAR